MPVEAKNESQDSLKPSRKWLVAQVTLLGSIATMYITTGTWDQEESVAMIGWFVQGFTTWLTPNVGPAIAAAKERGYTLVEVVLFLICLVFLVWLAKALFFATP